MRYLILSVDYEIFGNGTGDVLQHVVNPTGQMARLCQEQGVPLTVFVEAEEFVSFEKFSGPLSRFLKYDPAQKIRQQLVSLAQQGHDLQLHLHPQWFGARYEQNRWILRPDKQTVDDLFETQAEVTEYIGERKSLVEGIFRQAGIARNVRAYRAGAFSAQPGQKLLSALAANDIFIDSSVVKGLYGASYHGLDYRQAPSAKGPWRVKNDVAQEDPAGPIWEFPIYSLMGRRFQQATWSRLRAKFSRNVPKDRQMDMLNQFGLDKRNPLGFLKFLFQPAPIKLDFHNLAPGKLLGWIKAAAPPAPGLPDIVVLIGHTKEHVDNRLFAGLLQGISKDPELKVIGFEELAQILAPLAEGPLAG